MNLFYQPQLIEGITHLDPEESKHCVKVLRKSNGDTIRVTDGRGNFYTCMILDPSPAKCSFRIDETTHTPALPYSIHIAIAPTKNADRIEWFVEKAVELGVDTITLMDCENSERTYQKTERLTKVAISAMKQSLKSYLPVISPLTKFKSVIENSSATEKYIAYVDHSNPLHLQTAAHKNRSYLVLIGPEGDFSPNELSLALEFGFTKVSMGNSRLRTETAGMAACHILNLINN